MGAIGMTGAMASLIVVMALQPAAGPIEGRAATLRAMSAIATFIFFPSLGVTLIAGLLAIAATPGFHNAGWAWAKAVSGILIFEGGLHAIGPLQEEAKRSLAVLAAEAGQGAAAAVLASERTTLLVLILVSVANVALGVWRPRLTRIPP
jgi:hypothetical protein